MNRFPGTAWGLRRLCSLAAAALMACVFGTGTDTENGVADLPARIVDPSGAPLANVELRAHTSAYRPYWSGVENVLRDTGIPSTDADGSVRLRFRDTGTYVVEGRWFGRSLFFDTVKVDSGSGRALRFTVETPSPVSGGVHMLSGYQIDTTGLVFLRGTEQQAAIRADGSYDLGLLPASCARMALGVRYRARPKVNNYVLVKTDSAQPGKVILVANPNAASSGYCLDSLPGFPSFPTDSIAANLKPVDSVLSAAARQACLGRTGSRVQVNWMDVSGRISNPLGTYVIPDTARVIAVADILLISSGYPSTAGSSAVIRIASQGEIPHAYCIPDNTQEVSFETYLSTDEIKVNDLAGEPVCQ